MLPNLIIIGAGKCGTSSLHYYLNLHPDILMSEEKELYFFLEERNWKKGLNWYKSYFTGKAKIYGESTALYSFYPIYKGVPKRMYSIIPNTKLIYIVRDPIQRIISQYIHNCADGSENRTLSEALKKLDDNIYIVRSRYYFQLTQYLAFFPKSHILILTQEDLLQNRLVTLEKVFKFLNVDASFQHPNFYRIRHKSNDKRRKNQTGLFLSHFFENLAFKGINPDLRWHLERLFTSPFARKIEKPLLTQELSEKIIKSLKEDVNQLRQFTGNNFENWSV